MDGFKLRKVMEKVYYFSFDVFHRALILVTCFSDQILVCGMFATN